MSLFDDGENCSIISTRYSYECAIPRLSVVDYIPHIDVTPQLIWEMFLFAKKQRKHCKHHKQSKSLLRRFHHQCYVSTRERYIERQHIKRKKKNKRRIQVAKMKKRYNL